MKKMKLGFSVLTLITMLGFSMGYQTGCFDHYPPWNLIDADDDVVVTGFKGMDYICQEPWKFSLVALGCPQADKVVFEMYNPSSNPGCEYYIKTENHAPWSLFGNNNGDYFGRDWHRGSCNVKATAYDQQGNVIGIQLAGMHTYGPKDAGYECLFGNSPRDDAAYDPVNGFVPPHFV